MAVCNTLVYNEKLQCGNDGVAGGRLKLPLLADQTTDWMDEILNPQLPVLFLDTDGCSSAAESMVGGQICNRFEANLVAKLVFKLRKVLKLV